MLTTFKQSFAKDFADLPSDIRDKVEDFVNSALPKCNSVLELNNIKKLKGTKSFYRHRIGNYRIGFEIHDDKVTVHRVLHRSKIYKYFP
jgi:mRNA interferase RelE/StbE